MAQLQRYSTAAERARGCRWADEFQSEALVNKNEGAVTGSPTFSMTGGVTLDGTNDYVQYDLTGGEFDSDPISIVVEFTPDFNWDEDTQRYLYDSTAGTRTYLRKDNNASNNVIIVNVSNTYIASIASATYSPYWLQGQRNVLVVSSTTTDTDAWLNGTQILTNDVSAWTAKRPTELHVGCDLNGFNRFDGTIHSLQVYHAKLTAQEAQDFYNQTTYTYWDDATAIYKMDADSHDATNTRTLDSSGNGNHLSWTAGATAPTKLVRRGYLGDGTNDQLSNSPDSTFLTSSGSMSVLGIAQLDLVSTDFLVSKWETTGNNRSWRLFVAATTLRFSTSVDGTAIDNLDHSVPIEIGHKMFFSARTDGTLKYLDMDDGPGASKTPAGMPVDSITAPFEVMSSDTGSGPWKGPVYCLAVWMSKCLTPLQVHDARIKLMRELNNV